MICYNQNMKNLHKSENAIIFDNAFCNFHTGQLLSPIETQNYLIIQVTESYYRNAFQLGSHTQYCDIEITFPLTNGLSCATAEHWQTVNRHGCYLSFAGEVHALSGPKGSRFQTLAVNFKEGPCQALLDEIMRKKAKQRICVLPELTAPLSAIVAEFMVQENLYSGIHLDCLITEVLVKLVREGTHMPKSSAFSTEEKLPAIINYLDSHFLEIRSVEALSLQFGYTYSHICKAFKRVYGITPGEYILSRKMDYADALHREGNNLAQIAEELGYSTPYNFSRAFKNYRGKSPERYWREYHHA